MLDAFEIITTSGVVLWSRESAADVIGWGNPTYKYEKYTLKWTLVKDLGLIFVAVYQSLLHLTWVDKLLDNVRAIFVSIYKTQLEGSSAAVEKYAFDPYFDQQLRELDKATGGAVTAEPARIEGLETKVSQEDGDTGGPPPPPIPGLLKPQPQVVARSGDSAQNTPLQSPETSRPTTPVPGHLITGKGGPGGRGSRRSRKAAQTSSATASANASENETKRPKSAKANVKKSRIWNADGLADEDDGTTLDYSMNDPDVENSVSPTSAPLEFVSQESWGSKTKQGQFVLKDLDNEVNNILKNADTQKSKMTSAPNSVAGSAFGAISGYFRNIVGGKTLTKQDLEKPLRAMEDHLIAKNVARDAAVRLCEGVKLEMTGQKTGSFESIDQAIRPALEKSLRKILTPKGSLDLLQEITAVTSPANKQITPRPYVISIVGVNGVGKSTNLSKICYFLLQNNFRVLIAAGDTFRSGAVEQLNVHVRNLKELSARERTGEVDLYQKGYGKDAANVAKEAVAFAATNKYDVCLIDTAGRRHNDARLMGSLEKFAELARPDKILMVGEALAGSDLVGQAHNFSKAFGQGRALDGFIISKVDTVDAAIGALVSVVHSTGTSIYFVGVGQHYQDLRNFSVPWAVDLLMK